MASGESGVVRKEIIVVPARTDWVTIDCTDERADSTGGVSFGVDPSRAYVLTVTLRLATEREAEEMLPRELRKKE